MSLEERFLKLKGWRTSLVSELTGDILEIGVGTGLNFAHYRSSGRIWAVEPGKERAQLAHHAGLNAGLNLSVQIGLAEYLPHADDSFDQVVSSLVFCSVSDPQRTMNEIRRVLKPDGTLHMLEHICPQNRWLAVLASAVTPGWRRIAMNCHLDRPTLDRLHDNGWIVNVHERFGVFVRLSATQPLPF